MRIRLVISLLACLLPSIATAKPLVRDDVSAAVVLGETDVDLVFDDGTVSEVRLGRYGIEYWEPVAEYIQMGFSLGYSENDGRDPARPMETIDGHFGALGLRFDMPASAWLAFAGRVDLVYQRDRHTIAEREFEARMREMRAAFGPVAEFGPVTLALGGTWRNVDYRELIGESLADDAANETVRHADAKDSTGGFAALGLRTDNDGHIALRYDTGSETGWTLRFERTF